MEPLYEPKAVEERWQRTWEEEGLYNAEPGSGRETFVVAHPPPNVTGALHTGDALQISLADLPARWHRMRGFEPAWPATILADVAVAVAAGDERWAHAVGREVVVPFVERTVQVIEDERVDPEFGTGVLKVTPGHDPLDFEIGRDHGLAELTVI